MPIDKIGKEILADLICDERLGTKHKPNPQGFGAYKHQAELLLYVSSKGSLFYIFTSNKKCLIGEVVALLATHKRLVEVNHLSYTYEYACAMITQNVVEASLID